MSDFVINPIDIGKRVRQLRLKQNKTQCYYADMLYISPSYLALIESGKRLPTIEVLIHISKVADVTLDYLVYGDDTNMDSIQKTFDRLRATYSDNDIKNALRLTEYYLELINNKE